MQKEQDFSEWRAEQLGYVYLSRLSDLVIKENSKDGLFDFLVDISNNHKQTGRLFGVEVKATNGGLMNLKSVAEQYKNVSFPLVLLVFDYKTDKGFYQWIKEPKQDGRLLFNDLAEISNHLDNSSLQNIVSDVENWYAHQLTTSE